MFFEETLQASRSEESPLPLFLLEAIGRDGVQVNLVDLLKGRERLFALLPNGELRTVLLHQAILNEVEFQVKGEPRFHFMCRCSIVEQILSSGEGEQRRHRVSAPAVNRFSFKTASERADLRFFRDKPLEPCPECLQHYHRFAPEVDLHLPLEFSLISGKNLRDLDLLQRELELRAFAWQFLRLRGLCCESCRKEQPEERLRLALFSDGTLRVKCTDCRGER